jgi:hypothetical protein
MPNWSKKVLLRGGNMDMTICSKKDATLVRGLFLRNKNLIIGISNYKGGSNARMYGGMNMMHA